MLFNSFIFLLAFLPALLLIHAALRRRVPWSVSIGILLLASLVFYAWWEPANLGILLSSIGGNFLIGRKIADFRVTRPRWASSLRNIGVAANLAAIAWYKYPAFAVSIWQDLSGTTGALPLVVLPLAISFFTFQQIAYLVEVARGEPPESSLIRYSLFVSFFPHLIAGPIITFKEFRSFLTVAPAAELTRTGLSIGLALFSAGLAKKVLLADSLAPHVRMAFGAAYAGEVDFWTAWSGLFAYTLQLYFDFSGYSDMAIGLGLMFGFQMPINFFSPYRARNITEFWRRWHMTLSKFLRLYLYVPLGGNRHGTLMTARNIMVTMLLGGLWHGASWTFVLWGIWHGLLLLIHRIWIRVFGNGPRKLPVVGSVLTFFAVMAGWLIFRSPNLQSGLNMLGALVAPRPLPPQYLDLASNWSLYLVLTVGALIIWTQPNTNQIFLGAALETDGAPLPANRLHWRPNMAWATASALLLATSILAMSRETVFLYFQF